ncbi:MULTISPECIES: LysM peptidoglycan-binding domain-containing protein [unclassified Cryobacterium]|uniref:muramidase family protein n=2 Tax=Cryobacterium TaxID=69578 RepID=UPI00106D3312|nr:MULTISPECIES: LysM peptidoglycan-binding domain-containing protein [unclassified Cryobacterium]MEB0201370.1 LysM peptidoglycan-binding domain-containing protein [Cryobacterium sp. 5I3]MEB0286435.1 LysM peptidoglycan-binding domain-containing protein [Cryobacterium sp. 10S3]TFB92171.1 LysM peptidoglycan-binding domain-containing protein [Cryobacterium sp. MDB2-A-1]TFC11668.1 LysM peptidoglycan-binding domain-containing protein [Cryobacterium sp. MDB2-33-2]TFC15526.1 LysM peptidoglycan-bindin
MSAQSNRIVRPPASGELVPARPRKSSAIRSRALGIFAALPLAVACTVAIGLNLASPAEAASLSRKPLKNPAQLPASAGTSAPAQRVQAEAAPNQYTVVAGDTVSGIASRFGLSTAAVLASNGLSWSTKIFPGQQLTLAEGAAPAAAPAPTPVASELTRYTIVTGDTISGIAAAHGIAVAAVLSANGLDRASIIFPGQALVIPTGSAPAAAAPAVALVSATTAAPGASHTIATGETVSTIAAAAGVSIRAILQANNLGWSSIIYPGQQLSIPAPAAESVATASVTPLPAPEPGPAPTAVLGQVTPLSDEMRANARIIVATGRAAGVNDQGLVIALVAAAQESGLRNVHYGDRDSLGLFQQRPGKGWGSPDQVMDPVRASQAFFGGAGNPNPGVTRGLLDIPGWDGLSVTQAAQAVQLSAFPDYYAKWETSARSWLSELG